MSAGVDGVGLAGGLAEVGGGDCGAGRVGCCPGRGKGSGFWARPIVGTATRIAPSSTRDKFARNMILLSHRTAPNDITNRDVLMGRLNL